jgi:hypothetical protein
MYFSLSLFLLLSLLFVNKVGGILVLRRTLAAAGEDE